VSNLTLAAGNADIVVTLGYLFVDSLKQVAPHFPKTRFITSKGTFPRKRCLLRFQIGGRGVSRRAYGGPIYQKEPDGRCDRN